MSRAFSYEDPLLWNQLPPSVREADSLKSPHLRGNLRLSSLTELIVRAESGSPGVLLISRLIASSDPMRRHRSYLPDGSSRSGSWNMPTTNYSYTLSYSLIVLLLCFNLCVMISSVHITSIAPVHPGEGSSSLALLKVSSLFSPWRVVWEFFLIRCEVLWQGCLCVQIVKHSETNL